MHFACIERKSSHSTRLWNFLPNVWRRSELCPINQIVIICMRLEFSLNFPIVELWLIVVVFSKWKHRFKGCGCPIFCYISQKTYKSINTTKDLNYYILVRCEGDSNNFSAPILINKPIIRTAFGMTTPQDTNVITHYTSKWENIYVYFIKHILFAQIDRFHWLYRQPSTMTSYTYQFTKIVIHSLKSTIGQILQFLWLKLILPIFRKVSNQRNQFMTKTSIGTAPYRHIGDNILRRHHSMNDFPKNTTPISIWYLDARIAVNIKLENSFSIE